MKMKALLEKVQVMGYHLGNCGGKRAMHKVLVLLGCSVRKNSMIFAFLKQDSGTQSLPHTSLKCDTVVH